MESPGGRVASLVLVLVVGGAVWIFTTSPGYALIALLVGLVLWEYGRRSRYRHHVRYALAPQPRRQGGTGPAGSNPAPRPTTPRRADTGRRPPWSRTPAWKSPNRAWSAPTRPAAPARAKPTPRSAPTRRP